MTSLYPAETNNGVVTSWVPLTSVYTPDASCTSQFRLDGPSLVAFDPGYGLDIDQNDVCAPPAVTTWWEQGRLGHGNDAGHTAASLGPMVCPQSWSTVVTSVKDKSSTLAMCCPSGYSLAHGTPGSVAGDCLSNVGSGATLTFASTPDTQSTSWTIVTTTLASRSTVGAIAVVGWNVRLVTPTTSTSTSATSTSSSTTSSSNTGSGLSTTSPPAIQQVSTGLPTSVAAGIGVGVALGVIGIVALLVALYLMRRRKKSRMAAETHPPPQEHGAKPWGRYELHSQGVRQELSAQDVQRPPVELAGS